MTRKKATRIAPAKAGGNASITKGSIGELKRLQCAPRFVGPGWNLRDSDRTKFLATTGVDDVVKRLGEGVHAGDKEILENALGAQLGFHTFSDIVDRIDYWVNH
ncbi:hypothetical protein [Marilutibacter maris]|uniref:hypothetical protein n=1 Tax=Marilutibacter maris TaxID=1605891 RepID=UPI0011AE5ACF|nr:hypothetical protein [Lysobacter maris]